jgi:hypothetical protein
VAFRPSSADRDGADRASQTHFLLLVRLLFAEPCTEAQAYDEVRFALRALLPELAFELEPKPRLPT